MNENMSGVIEFLLSNFTLTFFVIGLITATISSFIDKRNVMSIFFNHFLYFSYGCSFLYNAVMHTVFANTAAAFIGWAPSPFQYEVGFASLGFALCGFIAASIKSLGFRAATILGVATFLWGAAGGHIFQMLTQHNFAPGNAGIIFWTDVFIPIVSFLLLWQQFEGKK